MQFIKTIHSFEVKASAYLYAKFDLEINFSSVNEQVKAILENSVIPNIETLRKSTDEDFSSRIAERKELVLKEKNLPTSQRGYNVQKLKCLQEQHREALESIANAKLFFEPSLFERFREHEDTGGKSKGLKIIPKHVKSRVEKSKEQ